jgi:LuxR family transcriptional regulator, maltose regulon positive regulatory protein
MSFALTKIQAPRPRVTWVARPSLQAALAKALAQRRVVLLCAPAGFGKTALLAQALANPAPGEALAWISADAGDDLQRLLGCMLAALDACDPPWRTAPETLATRAAEADASVRGTIAAAIINTLEATGVTHGIIAFDDLHRVDDPAFFAFLDLLIERLGPRWSLALASRVEPPLALARLRAAGELAEFRQPQLQFDREETRALVTGLDAAVAEALFERTQGWPAGLRLALEALQQAGGSEGGAQAAASRQLERVLQATDRPLFELLTTEVVDQLQPELAAFLLRVSVLPELEAQRCAAVSAQPDAARLLDEVERLGLFVEVLDSPTQSLRLHSLFRAALQRRLALEQPGLLVELRRRAAATETDPFRRIQLLLEAGEVEEAARALEAHAPPAIAVSGTSTVINLLARFPAPWREHSAELLFVRGLVSWVHWDFPAMLGHLDRAAAAFAMRGDRLREQLTHAYRATALIARGRLDEAAAMLDELQPLDLSAPTRIVVLNAQSWLAIDSGRLYDVAPLVERMLDLLRDCDRIDLWYQTTPPNRLPGLPGMVEPLRRHAELLLRVAGEGPTPLRAMGMLVRAWCALWQGRLDEAAGLRELADEDARWSGSTGALRGHELALAAFGHALAGDGERAMGAALTRVRELQPGYGAWGRYVLWLFATRVAALTGQLPALREAWSRLEAARALLDAGVPAASLRVQLPLAAQLAWLEGRPADAISGWREALESEEAIDLYGQAAEVRLRCARALVTMGERRAAAAQLQPVFERARQEGGPGGALLATDALLELAQLDWQMDLDADHAAELRAWARSLAQRRVAASRAAEASAARRDGGGVRLSPREQQVLDMIAAGEGNKHIARALDLSLHTVKRHVANILDKLDVASRGQAAAWRRAHHA